MPVVDVVGVVTERGDGLEAVLITRHLDYSLPFRTLFARGGMPDLRARLLDAGAELLVRLHLGGFFWGDCSLSNTLFRRDAGALAAYLVDAETGELHPSALRRPARARPVDRARRTSSASCSTSRPSSARAGRADAGGDRRRARRAAYEGLWHELTREEVFGTDERYRIDERLHRLNELGFDVEELELVAGEDGYRLRLEPARRRARPPPAAAARAHRA